MDSLSRNVERARAMATEGLWIYVSLRTETLNEPIKAI